MGEIRARNVYVQAMTVLLLLLVCGLTSSAKFKCINSFQCPETNSNSCQNENRSGSFDLSLVAAATRLGNFESAFGNNFWLCLFALCPLAFNTT